MLNFPVDQNSVKQNTAASASAINQITADCADIINGIELILKHLQAAKNS